MAMTKQQKTYAGIGAAVLLLMLLGGAAAAADDKPDDDKPDDDKPDDEKKKIVTVKKIDLPPKRKIVVIGEIDDPPQIEDPAVVINKYLRPVPTQGALYQIQSGDTPPLVARQALGVNRGHPAIVPYIVAMAEVAMNLGLYDVLWEKVGMGFGPAAKGRTITSSCKYGELSRRYTAEIETEDMGIRRFYIGDAFCPKHPNNLHRMRQGNSPERSTDAYGQKLAAGSSFGLIWFPKVVQVDPFEISALNPPAELRARMPNIYG